jgi:hypothetical protein
VSVLLSVVIAVLGIHVDVEVVPFNEFHVPDLEDCDLDLARHQ